MHSNLEYIRLFRHEDRLDGQDEYYLTTLASAADFLLTLTAADLKLPNNNDYQLHLSLSGSV